MRLQADKIKEWDFAVEVRGMVIPTLSPLDAPEKTVVRNPGATERSLRRRPGAIVRVLRFLFGDPADLGEVVETAETDHTRELCLAFVPPSHHHLVAELNGGDLMLLFSAYQGAQLAWCQNIRDEAERAVRVKPDAAMPAAAPPSGGGKIMVPPTPLRAGSVPEILRACGGA